MVLLNRKVWLILSAVKCLIFLQNGFVFGETQKHSTDFALKNLIPSDYDSSMRPVSSLNANSTATRVFLTLFVRELLDVDDVQQTVRLDLTIIEEWYDQRLNYYLIDSGAIQIAEPELIQQFWRPDLYIVNGQRGQIIDAFNPVEKLTITDRGLIQYAFRVNTQMHCSLNLETYPHDHNYCDIRLSSIQYNSNQLVFNIKYFDVYRDDYPQYKIRTWYVWKEGCNQFYNPLPENSCVVATFKLVRHLSYYIIRLYLLTFLAVAISMISFWIPVSAWPARIVLTVVVLLNLITQDISVNNDIGVNYVTSFHWWMMWLHGFIYLEVVEYCCALAWAHFITDKKNFAKLLEQAPSGLDVSTIERTAIPIIPPYLEGYYFGNNSWYTKCGQFFDRFVYFFFGPVDLKRDPYFRNKIDYVCRPLFPLTFLLFCLIYSLATFAPWAGNYY